MFKLGDKIAKLFAKIASMYNCIRNYTPGFSPTPNFEFFKSNGKSIYSIALVKHMSTDSISNALSYGAFKISVQAMIESYRGFQNSTLLIYAPILNWRPPSERAHKSTFKEVYVNFFTANIKKVTNFTCASFSLVNTSNACNYNSLIVRAIINGS